MSGRGELVVQVGIASVPLQPRNFQYLRKNYRVHCLFAHALRKSFMVAIVDSGSKKGVLRWRRTFFLFSSQATATICQKWVSAIDLSVIRCFNLSHLCVAYISVLKSSPYGGQTDTTRTGYFANLTDLVSYLGRFPKIAHLINRFVVDLLGSVILPTLPPLPRH